LAILLSQKLYFMISNKCNSALLLLAFLCGMPLGAEAQASLGTRAAGMAGAFVGVADDASAVYWNPAGLATGALVSLIATVSGDGISEADAVAGERPTARMVALSLPPIGLAYYRHGAYGTQAATPAVMGPDSREEVRRSVHAITTSTVGVSLLQSVSEYVVVGATPKLVRGTVDGHGTATFDVDAGVMIAVNRLRLGLVARNLTAPSFAADGGGREIALAREARIGAAWGSTWPGHTRLVVSLDGDLTARATPSGDRRDVAAGVETWWRERRLGIRGGVRGSTIGGARAAVAAGLSAGVTAGMQIEGHVTLGHAGERGWSVVMLAGF
jgi:hypothetical protein